MPAGAQGKVNPAISTAVEAFLAVAPRLVHRCFVAAVEHHGVAGGLARHALLGPLDRRLLRGGRPLAEGTRHMRATWSTGPLRGQRGTCAEGLCPRKAFAARRRSFATCTPEALASRPVVAGGRVHRLRWPSWRVAGHVRANHARSVGFLSALRATIEGRAGVEGSPSVSCGCLRLKLAAGRRFRVAANEAAVSRCAVQKGSGGPNGVCLALPTCFFRDP